MVSQHSGSAWYDSPYRFNGKELDEETNLHYYGARYYNSNLSIWLSVDPLADKYPSHNPYNYVLNRPTMLIDPNGMEVYPPEDGDFVDGQEWNDTDGSWVYNEENDEWTTIGGERGNMMYLPETEVTGEKSQNATVSQKNYNTSDPRYWSMSDSKTKQWAYNQMNSFYLTLQVVDFDLLYDDQYENPIRGGAFHNMDGSSHYGDVTLDFVSNATIFGPKVKMIPRGVLNASQFSSLFKGTAIARSSPAVRGLLNRGYNQVVNQKVDPLILTVPAQSIKPMFEIDE